MPCMLCCWDLIGNHNSTLEGGSCAASGGWRNVHAVPGLKPSILTGGQLQRGLPPWDADRAVNPRVNPILDPESRSGAVLQVVGPELRPHGGVLQGHPRASATAATQPLWLPLSTLAPQVGRLATIAFMASKS